jgi:uncharacterized membrane protein
MVFQHIYYFYDVSNNYSTSYAHNIVVESSGIIARTLFILLVGISLSFNNNTEKNKEKEKNQLKKRFMRTAEIGFHALLISFMTFIFYPQFFVRFGVLHFICLTTFICSFIVPYKNLVYLMFILSLIYTPPKINPMIDTITGASVNYKMMDYFSLKDWLPLVLFGIIIGYNKNILDELEKNKYLNKNNILTKIGRNALPLYSIHIILLLIFYNILKNNNKIMA